MCLKARKNGEERTIQAASRGLKWQSRREIVRCGLTDEIEIDQQRGAALVQSFPKARETLENQRHSRDNGPVIAGQDWVDGRQAARTVAGY